MLSNLAFLFNSITFANKTFLSIYHDYTYFYMATDVSVPPHQRSPCISPGPFGEKFLANHRPDGQSQ